MRSSFTVVLCAAITVACGAEATSIASTNSTVVAPETTIHSPATVTVPAERSTTQVQHEIEVPPPIPWGRAGTTVDDRCTQWEALLAEHAPPGGWDEIRMSRYMSRESACCPQVLAESGPRTIRGGDLADESCSFIRVVNRTHRSDAGLLQINGINYDPARCKNTCLSDMLGESVTVETLGDPVLNIRAAAHLCEWWRDAGYSCYRPWS